MAQIFYSVASLKRERERRSFAILCKVLLSAEIEAGNPMHRCVLYKLQKLNFQKVGTLSCRSEFDRVMCLVLRSPDVATRG